MHQTEGSLASPTISKAYTPPEYVAILSQLTMAARLGHEKICGGQKEDKKRRKRLLQSEVATAFKSPLRGQEPPTKQAQQVHECACVSESVCEREQREASEKFHCLV